MIELKHVTKSFGSTILFKDVTASLHGGRVYLVTGRNGSGKSTLLRLIGGLTQPTMGEVVFTDDNARLGYLGHATFLYPNLTAVENLAFWQRACGQTVSTQAVMSMLDHVGLAPFAHTKAAVFSRGMAQRLSLARVLLLQPDIVLLDEPETGLDALSRVLLEDEVASARKRGACVLWVSHQAVERSRADAVFELSGRRLSLVEGTNDAPCAERDGRPGHTEKTDQPADEAGEAAC